MMDSLYTPEGPRGPTKLWLFVVGTDLFLLIVFWLPWIVFENSQVQQANYHWIEERLTSGQNNVVTQKLVEVLHINPGNVDSVKIIDAGGWHDLRQAIAGRRGVGGGWLLVSQFSTPLRWRFAAQVLLIAGVAIWTIANVQVKRFWAMPATLLLIFTILVTLAHVLGLPKLDTFGHDDSFSLALLMAIVLARPGWGCWLTLVGNAVLAISIVVYLGLESPVWRKPSGVDTDLCWDRESQYWPYGESNEW